MAVLYRSVQRAAEREKPRSGPIVRSWSRNPKFDTRYRYQRQEGAALQGQGLGAFLSRLSAHRKPLGRTLWRGGELPYRRPSIRGLPLWAGQLSTGALAHFFFLRFALAGSALGLCNGYTPRSENKSLPRNERGSVTALLPWGITDFPIAGTSGGKPP